MTCFELGAKSGMGWNYQRKWMWDYQWDETTCLALWTCKASSILFIRAVQTKRIRSDTTSQKIMLGSKSAMCYEPPKWLTRGFVGIFQVHFQSSKGGSLSPLVQRRWASILLKRPEDEFQRTPSVSSLNHLAGWLQIMILMLGGMIKVLSRSQSPSTHRSLTFNSQSWLKNEEFPDLTNSQAKSWY